MRGLYFRFLSLSILATLVLTGLSLLFLSRLTEMASAEHRERFLSFMAETVQQDINGISIEDIVKKGDSLLEDQNFHVRRFEREAGHMRRMPPPDGRPPFSGKHGPGPGRQSRLWIIDGSDNIIAKNSDEKIPELPSLPDGAGEMTFNKDFFRLGPSIYVVRLTHPTPLYLVSKERERPFSGPLFGTQAIITFATVGLAFLLSLSFVFVYLQKKSREARSVLLRLEQGDLQARFQIKRFDEYGGLLNDFNRMAQEIEKLVHRVQSTESTRRNLLQELGHDLRTPLTSLTTSLETYKSHHEKISAADREELFKMMTAEVDYLQDLLEKLMLISSLDEPSYRQNAEHVDLVELINYEIKVRQSSSPLQWTAEPQDPARHIVLSADPHLIKRMLRNALDNSARFAKSSISIQVHETPQDISITVTDDGPGLSPEGLETFGQHRRKRTVQDGQKLEFSLGLGSVIMKAIAELHGGTVSIANVSNRDKTGAILSIHLPKSRRLDT